MAVVLCLLAIGAVLLIVGAEFLVRGATRLATAVGVSSLVVGLTVVAFGTSAPEVAVSVQAALAGQGDVAFGNVVGSNLFNLLFILGACAAIRPLIVARQLVKFDLPVMIGVTFVLLVCASDGSVSRGEGALLFLGIILYTGMLIRMGRRNCASTSTVEQRKSQSQERSFIRMALSLLFVVVGLALLVLGAQLLVDSSVQIARALGVSELVISLTIVAAGTSLSEVATSVMATFRGERDIAIGNVVGSCTFNILSVLGLAALATSQGVSVAPAALALDIPVLLAVSCLCFPIFLSGLSISRFEGTLFLGYYVMYVAYLILSAMQHQAQYTFGSLVVTWIVPLTILWCLVLWSRGHKRDSFAR